MTVNERGLLKERAEELKHHELELWLQRGNHRDLDTERFDEGLDGHDRLLAQRAGMVASRFRVGPLPLEGT